MTSFNYAFRTTEQQDAWDGILSLRTLIDREIEQHRRFVDSLAHASSKDLAKLALSASPGALIFRDDLNMDVALSALHEATRTLAASPLGWQGDARSLDDVGFLIRVADNAVDVWAVVIKQDRDGETFVVSDIPWPWETPSRDEWALPVMSPEDQWRKDRGYPDGCLTMDPPAAAREESADGAPTDILTAI